MLKSYFPKLVSYDRLIALKSRVFKYVKVLISYIMSLSSNTGKFYVDSTHIKTCHNKRIKSHKVFQDLGERGMSSTQWFFGFKLHLVINEFGQIINFIFTPGNEDDRSVINHLVSNLSGLKFTACF